MSTSIACGNAKLFEHVRQTPHGVRATAKAEQVDVVAGTPNADDRNVAIDDLAAQADANCQLDGVSAFSDQ